MRREQRQHVRVKLRLVTFIKFLDSGKVQRVLTRNISEAGICVVAEELIPPGTSVNVELTLPDRDTPIQFTAQVVWSWRKGIPAGNLTGSSSAEAGMTFVRITPKDQTLLKQYAVLNAPPPAPSGE